MVMGARDDYLVPHCKLCRYEIVRCVIIPHHCVFNQPTPSGLFSPSLLLPWYNVNADGMKLNLPTAFLLYRISGITYF